MDAPGVVPYQFIVRNNKLLFSSTGKLTGAIAVFSGIGKLISNLTFSELNPLIQSISLPELAPGLNVLRLTLNNITSSCQVLRVGNELFLQQNVFGSRNSGEFQLTKSAAAAPKDILIAKKAQFTDKQVPINSYDTTLTIQMDSVTVVDTGAIAWGKVENPTARCVVGTLPEFDALKANSKLPDPFMKVDGTRIKNKSEWACRREEIRKQMIKYILGDKPIPAKGSVTGTVSTNKITVNVSEGGKSCTFSVAVNMNGATQPAPSIISYGAGATAPSGVAKITFTAVEKDGGSGPKTGPFYDLYGTNHPAGYMVAQAWQVSRILDVMEQNPGIFDPYRVGVTGCSRNGKGAFFGGVLDNRIALTIPCESGIGGTVGLRLVEQLDKSGEWPYHSISYVRWLSEIALGKFTNANSATGDNTDKLPVDMHEAMALIAPRAIYIVDNASTTYAGLDRASAYVTGMAGKAIFKALGLDENFTYECASGGHCEWRSQYTASLNATVDKYLLNKTSTKTGTFNTDLSGKPDVTKYYDFDATELPGTF
jgi:hypothetical protein